VKYNLITTIISQQDNLLIETFKGNKMSKEEIRNQNQKSYLQVKILTMEVFKHIIRHLEDQLNHKVVDNHQALSNYKTHKVCLKNQKKSLLY
jgi:hypothetical protein